MLELGGSDSFVVLEDADVEKAAKVAAQARLINTGQSCIAAKRFLVMEPVVQRFQELFIENLSSMKIGDPMDPETDIGPVAKGHAVDELGDQLSDAEEKGGHVTVCNIPPEGSGYFFPTMVVTNVTPDMKIVTEEVFGPIAPVIVVNTEEEIVEIANNTEFGRARVGAEASKW